MKQYDDLIDTELGSRHPSKNIAQMISLIAFIWSIFQIWVASPLQFSISSALGINWLVFNTLDIRSIHLAIAMLLAFFSFPICHSTTLAKKIPLYDWVCAILGFLATIYVYICYSSISERIGIPTYYDIIISLCGMVLLLEASRRVLGPAIVIIASIFLLYAYFGESFPSILAHRDNSISSIVSHQWLSSEGVFGTALGVSADFVFLYVLFGSFLEIAGAGNFFIQLSFALLGRFTGGPAKAAVVASGLMGMMSGSSIANTITVGSFTIPLMKKMGLTAEKAGAIEVSAGINGQIMPPVMGAAAFIMSEYLSIPYTEIIQHAFLPAILVYIALLYIVHIEAKKLGLGTLSAESQPKFLYRILRAAIVISSLFILFGAVYFVIYGLQYFNIPGIISIFSENSIYPISLLIFVIYVAVLKYQAKFPELEKEDESGELKMPKVAEILRSGIHFFIPVVILIWTLMIERLSPALAAYWTIMFLIFTVITQHIIKAIIRKQYYKISPCLKQGLYDCISAMILGAKNMVTVAIATATAGIIVGTVSLTGIGLSIGAIVDYLANGDLFTTLIITGVICIVLGMGMPTTACYIIVSTLMVPVLEYATHKNGLVVPPLALHLFVFYFGLMADVTPPVGLASYAAAAVAKGNSLKTSIQAFLYNMRTMTLPFIFVFNSQLLLYNITSIGDFVIIITSSVVGIFVISAATQGYFLIKSKIYESLILLIVGVSLLYPQAWINLLFEQFTNTSIHDLKHVVDQNAMLRVKVLSINLSDKLEENVVILKATGETIENKLSTAGISALKYDKGEVIIQGVKGDSSADKAGINPSDKIIKIDYSLQQPNKNIVLIPIIVILYIIVLNQRKRRKVC